jgi:hypothetical protein
MLGCCVQPHLEYKPRNQLIVVAAIRSHTAAHSHDIFEALYTNSSYMSSFTHQPSTCFLPLFPLSPHFVSQFIHKLTKFLQITAYFSVFRDILSLLLQNRSALRDGASLHLLRATSSSAVLKWYCMSAHRCVWNAPLCGV